MNPEQIAGFQRRETFREQIIDPVIGFEVAAAVAEETELIVKQRPQDVIGKSLVVASVILLVDIDRRVCDAGATDDFGFARFGPGKLSAPAEP